MRAIRIPTQPSSFANLQHKKVARDCKSECDVDSYRKRLWCHPWWLEGGCARLSGEIAAEEWLSRGHAAQQHHRRKEIAQMIPRKAPAPSERKQF
ncbi:hypothetical protein VTL71DRAFT_6350 [Oculimacula yallundae]|uniref:Uncharacterized protein n=1 Tax=Oculimacula yallundae TaxID=86028 RepID=A0ABR4BWQ3_9HELO